jgi:gluconate 2-dehydrogenase gamma chain
MATFMEDSNEENKDDSGSSTKSTDTNRRSFLKYVAAGAVGVGIASAVEIPALSNMLTGENIDLQQAQTQLKEANDKIDQLNSQLQQDTSQINNLQSQVSSLQSQQASANGIKEISINEQKIVEAIVETIIPSDSNGPGAKEAGVIYFIDKQLSSDYGNNARMYMRSPFVQSGTAGPLTVDGITYTEGTPDVPWQAATKYQYNMTLRNFWRYGLEALQNYTNSILGKNFEDLSESDRVQMLNNLYDNKPTDFNGIVPKDFFQEVIFMTWSGFFMDPM